MLGRYSLPKPRRADARRLEARALESREYLVCGNHSG